MEFKNNMENLGYRLGNFLKLVPPRVRWGLSISVILLIIIFPEVVGSFILLVAIAAILIFLFLQDDWDKWPTLEEYWEKHPKTKTSNGTKCYYCGCNRMVNSAWGKSWQRRVNYCQQCNRGLYRSVRERYDD